MTSTATWPSANDRRPPGARFAHWVVLGVAGSKRHRQVLASCERLGVPPPAWVAWADWLDRPAVLDEAIARPCVLKIEPPGDDPAVHHALITHGAHLLGLLPPAPLQHGELGHGRLWFEGFRWAMQAIGQSCTRSAAHPVNPPDDILAMTDKLTCQRRLQSHGVATPPLLGPIEGFDDLQRRMDEHGADRVFVKARYGSSAAGVVAYRRHLPGRHQATTTARQVIESGRAGETRLFNDKRVSRYLGVEPIRDLIDRIAADGAYAEVWITKPRWGAGHFDLRMLALLGSPAHRVARLSPHTMTNLHLDAERLPAEQVLSQAAQARIEQLVTRAASAFPASGVIGFDVLPHRDRPCIIEANAFGDLLPGLLWQGLDTHAVLHARMGQPASASAWAPWRQGMPA
ncbi:STM4014 family protein [Ideonella sp. DXS29W]|uniref:STM4014 family protein n=1 Tax=Ideonella lacteola TaxID=2984193 RepID=A0ABU9BYS4_9BURK